MTHVTTPVEEGVIERRRALGVPLPGEPGAQPLSGLALSGGGIRSATFCFGVVKALAANGQLLRFDLLSSVSGGGFIGATVGRLFDRAGHDPGLTAQAVQEALGDADRRWFGWWLRAHARYLTPRGASDMLYMASLMLRNLLGVHLELALLSMLVGCVLAMANLLGWSVVQALAGVSPQGTLPSAWPWLPSWLPTLFTLTPIPLGLMVLTMTAYWAVPTGTPQPLGVLAKRGVLWVLAMGLLLRYSDLFIQYLPGGEVAWLALCAWSLAWVLGIGLTSVLVLTRGKDDTRARLTRWQANLFGAVLLLLVVGVIDRGAWWLAFEFETSWLPGAVLVVTAATLRAMVSRLGDSSGTMSPGSARIGLGLVNAMGWLLTLSVLTWWVSLLYKVVFPRAFGGDGLQLLEVLCSLLPVALCGLVYAMASGTNVSFLNQSSLHHFYRGRLVRSYLGAANGQRFVSPASGQTRPTDPKPGEAFGQYQVAQIDDTHAQDDCAMFDYAPHTKGGPVHLIGVCLNRTQRGQGGEFSQDRKALPLTIAPGGWVSVARRPWRRAGPVSGLSLGQWVSISGAALAPGLGAMTRSGLSALATFAGARLGYWWTADDVAGLPKPRWGHQLFAKSRRLLDELRGRFLGDLSRDWFLTDGGHFENTAVYALLRERTELIVLADCGADPQYRFCDLENLVRKARIDHGAHIEFLRPRKGKAGSWPLFGSLSDLASANSQACVALARVHYDPEGDRSASSGVMILLKPNVFKGLPVDLMNFKAANPDFPQQGTSDQSFDEAQWECHFRLGEEIGQRLTEDVFTLVQGDLHEFFEADAGQASVLGANDTEPPVSVDDSWSRRVAGNTVRASISLGAAAAVGTTAWQAWDQFNSTLASNERVQEQALQALTERWGKLGPLVAGGGGGPHAAALAAELLRAGQRICPTDVEGGERWLDHQEVVQKILKDAVDACANDASPACRQLMQEAHDSASCLSMGVRGQAVAQATCPAQYWGRDYTNADNTGCPGEKAPELDMAAGAAAPPDEVVAMGSPSQEAPQATAPSAVPDVVPQVVPQVLPPEDLPSTRGQDGFASQAPGPGAAAQLPEPTTEAPTAPPPIRATPTPAKQGVGRPPPKLADASKPLPVPSTLEPASVQGAPGLCQGRQLYVQIYGPTQRDLLRTYRDDWQKWGLSVPPIEDVVVTARKEKRRSPTPVSTTEVRYFSERDRACAQKLVEATHGEQGVDPRQWTTRRVRGLGQPGVLELWVAPPAAKAL